MIMITATIYPLPLLKKSTPPFLLTTPVKIQKVQVLPFWPTLKIFQSPPLQKWGRTLYSA